MNQQETAHYLIKKMSEYTTSVTKKITFNNAKQCALICANEVKAQYEIEHDAKLFLFWDEVIKYITAIKLETK
jgi:hypothetical protein